MTARDPRRQEAERMLHLLIVQHAAMSNMHMTDKECYEAHKRYLATHEQIIELMGVGPEPEEEYENDHVI